MPYRVIEYIPDQVLLLQTWGLITAAEADAFNREGIACLERTPAPVMHWIADIRHASIDHHDLRDMAKHLSGLRHPKQGWQFVISDSRLFTFFSSVVVQLVKGDTGRYFSTSDPEAVRERLARLLPDQVIPPIPVIEGVDVP
jgi:hypothetical protein